MKWRRTEKAEKRRLIKRKKLGSDEFRWEKNEDRGKRMKAYVYR